MIGRVNHIAIAVPDLQKGIAKYRELLGAHVTEPHDLPEHGVTTVFVKLPNTVVELVHPLGDKSPIAGFLAKNPDGGMHHICYDVEDIKAAVDELVAKGARVLNREPKIGAHGNPVVFLHPKDFNGVLVELEQPPKK
ncbi:MAG: methylmalonyl-CoA epimerase [Magnetococcales bacterium]|nr:methylmalonyl-CoA epimerase [Magnetococcales bacterium]